MGERPTKIRTHLRTARQGGASGAGEQLDMELSTDVRL